MAAYRRVYDSRHLQAACQEPGSAGTLRSEIEYGLPLPFLGLCAILHKYVNKSQINLHYQKQRNETIYKTVCSRKKTNSIRGNLDSVRNE